MVGVAVIGAGYWGPNLVRNIQATPQLRLTSLCDVNVARAEAVLGRYSTVRATGSLQEVLADPEVEAVAVATPAATHLEVALAALEAGKHVLVEKPLASSYADGLKLVDAAEDRGLVLMLDHTFCYTPVVQRLRKLVHDGDLGDLQYLDSVRINLGLVQPDIDVLWDLAPHDLSILDSILPEGVTPVAVAAHGSDPASARPRLRRVPHGAAVQRRDRARARELALADQDPHHDRRRLGPHRGVGRPQPDAAACRLRPRRRLAATAPRTGGCPTASVTWSRPRCPAARRCAP